MSGTLALASVIAAMPRDALVSLVRRRRPQAAAGIADPISLASELLRPDSISRAIGGLDRDALAALLRLADDPSATDDDRLAGLAELGLVGREADSPVSLPEVAEALRHALEAAGSSPEALLDDEASAGGREHSRGANDAAGGSGAADRAASTSSWFGAGLTAVAQLAEVLRALPEVPARLNRTGAVAVAALRALSEATRVDTESVAHVLSIADRARLTAASAVEPKLIRTPAAQRWLEAPHTERWLALARANLERMPLELRLALRARGAFETAASTGDSPGAADLRDAARRLRQRFPLIPNGALEAANGFAADAEHLGLTEQGRLSGVAHDLLRSPDDPEIPQRVGLLFPPTARGVYVQPDLSVVVPGPPAPADETALVSLTAPEQIGVASTRRISEASLARALERGLSEPDARAVFERLSLTGIPQPLDYLLRSLADQLGSIRVEEHHDDEGRTRISVARHDLAETLLVDRALQHLQLRRLPGAGPDVLVTRLRLDHVLPALADARYPATAMRADPPPAPQAAPDGALADDVAAPDDAPLESPAPPLSDALAELVERVYLAARAEPGSGDITRRLELAMRDRTVVRVTAESRGQRHTFTLLPVSVGSGRLRASDQAAGVERTLPVNLITAVESV